MNDEDRHAAAEEPHEAGGTPEPARQGNRLVWAAVAAGLAVIVVGIVFAGRFGTDPSISASPLIGRPAPEVALPRLDGGGTVHLSDFAGDVVVVNFWASWCLSCRQEHPALIAAADEYAEFGVTFVGIDVQDSDDAARAYLDELGWGEHNVYVVDVDSQASFDFGLLGVPETFFVDRQGTVVAKITGPVSYGLLSRTIDDILLGNAVGSVKTGEVQNR